MERGYVVGGGAGGGQGAVFYPVEEIINSHLYRMVFLFICQEDRA